VDSAGAAVIAGRVVTVGVSVGVSAGGAAAATVVDNSLQQLAPSFDGKMFCVRHSPSENKSPVVTVRPSGGDVTME